MASYTDTLLASGERILRREHQHWFVLIANARYAVLALVIALVAGVLGLATKLSGTLLTVLGWAVFALFVFGVLSVIWSAVRFRSQEYVITNRRLIHAEGVINKKATDSSLEKINDASLTESVFGRMFGFGDLDVLTASEEGIERLRMLRNAKDFKKSMIEAKHELEMELMRPTMPPLRSEPVAPASAPVAQPSAPVAEPPPSPYAAAPAADVGVPDAPPAAPPADDGRADTAGEVAEALDHLADLRGKGLITPEEYDAKKAELLGRL